MLTKKQFMLLFCVFLFAAVAFQTQPVEAYDNEFNDVQIVAGEYSEHFIALTTGDVISGYLETDIETMGLDFFICDAANFLIWDTGGSATGYEVNTNMHTLGFEWTVTYSDTWYIVLSNVDGSTDVWVDYAIDINGDETPFYSTSEYTYTRYGLVLEIDEYYSISSSLSAGTVVDGHFSTFFATDGLDFFIMDEANFDDWVLGFSSTGYSVETNMHTATIDAYTIPTTDTWYFVFVSDSETDALTFSCGIDVDTSGVGVGGGGFTLMSVVGVVAGLLILLILCCVCRSKKKPTDQTPTPPTVDHYRAPPSTPATTGTVREREIVRDRVLVICPYCGSKNEQGVLTCHNCDADL